MSKLPNIQELADSVLAMVEEKEQVKTAQETPVSSMRTDVGTALKEAADLVRSLEGGDVTYNDVHRVLGHNNVKRAMEATSAEDRVFASELANSCKKIAAALRAQGATDETGRATKAAHVVTAAIGIEHLVRGIK